MERVPTQENSEYKIEIADNGSPLAVIFGAETFLGFHLVSFFAKTIPLIGFYSKKTKRLNSLLANKNLTLLKEAALGSFLKNSGSEFDVSYVFNCSNNQAARDLALKKQARLVEIISLDQQEAAPLPKAPSSLDWRIVKHAFAYGPQMNVNSTALLPRLFKEAALNQSLNLPRTKKMKIYPLFITDLLEGIQQACFTPNTSGKEFLFIGNPISINAFAELLIQNAQNTQEPSENNQAPTPQIDSDLSQETRKELSWQPQANPENSMQITLAYFLKNVYSLEKKIPLRRVKKEKPSDTIVSAAEEERNHKKETAINETPLEEEALFVIDETIESSEEEKAPEPIPEEPVLEKEPEKTSPSGLSPKNKASFWPRAILFLFFTSLLWLILPLAKFGFCGWSAFKHLQQSRDLVSNQEWGQALGKSKESKDLFILAKETTEQLKYLQKIAPGLSDTLGKLTDLGINLSRAMEISVQSGETTQTMAEAVLKGNQFDFPQKIEELSNQLEALDSSLAITETLAKSRTTTQIKPLRNKLAHLGEEVSGIRNYLQKSKQLIPHLETILGLDGKRKTFLIILQNNMELRPTGGFIGSFALLSFESGYLLDFEVNDVYSADGQLKGHVDPPKQIRDILGEKNWYLRDANWDPDFPSASETIEWFFEKETGRRVDGVIGFNLSAAQKIVANFGEIYLPDFQEKINANNLFERAEFYSEKDFFPGSTQKKVFLSALANEIFEILKNLNTQKYLAFGKAILEGLEKKEILLALHDPQLKNTLAKLAWDGRIKTISCKKDNCLSDYLLIVEANLGINKANYFLKRDIQQSIEISPQKLAVKHHLVINYENTSRSSAWPAGNYRNFMRLYLDPKTKVEQIVSYDPRTPSNKKDLSFETEEEQDKLVVGFLLEVPINSRRSLEIWFSKSTNFSSESWSYSFYLQKQSGFGSTPYSLYLTFPENWQPLQVSPVATLIANKLLFNQQFDQDLKFTVEFGL